MQFYNNDVVLIQGSIRKVSGTWSLGTQSDPTGMTLSLINTNTELKVALPFTITTFLSGVTTPNYVIASNQYEDSISFNAPGSYFTVFFYKTGVIQDLTTVPDGASITFFVTVKVTSATTVNTTNIDKCNISGFGTPGANITDSCVCNAGLGAVYVDKSSLDTYIRVTQSTPCTSSDWVKLCSGSDCSAVATDNIPFDDTALTCGGTVLGYPGLGPTGSNVTQIINSIVCSLPFDFSFESLTSKFEIYNRNAQLIDDIKMYRGKISNYNSVSSTTQLIPVGVYTPVTCMDKTIYDNTGFNAIVPATNTGDQLVILTSGCYDIKAYVSFNAAAAGIHQGLVLKINGIKVRENWSTAAGGVNDSLYIDYEDMITGGDIVTMEVWCGVSNSIQYATLQAHWV